MKKTTKKIKRVAFFGDAMMPKMDKIFVEAYKTAKLLAEHNFIIVNATFGF